MFAGQRTARAVLREQMLFGREGRQHAHASGSMSAATRLHTPTRIATGPLFIAPSRAARAASPRRARPRRKRRRRSSTARNRTETQRLHQRDEGVDRHRFGGGSRSPAGEHVDDVEDAEGVERRNRNATVSAGRRSGSVMSRNCRQRPGTVDARRLVQRRSMFCRPASSRSATNGVVFHTSASTTGTHAATGSANHVGAGHAALRHVVRHAAGLSKMNRQTSAATTVGLPTAENGRPHDSAPARDPLEAERQHQAAAHFERHGQPANTAVCTAASRTVDRSVPRHSWPRPVNGRPSHGMRRSWRCSDSQVVQPIGTSAVRPSIEQRREHEFPGQARLPAARHGAATPGRPLLMTPTAGERARAARACRGPHRCNASARRLSGRVSARCSDTCRILGELRCTPACPDARPRA